MTSANLLARLRTLLDEASASYWTDTEAYAALADGQNAVVTIALGVLRASRMAKPNGDVALPFVLKPLYAVQTGTVASGQSAATLTGNVLEVLWVTYNSATGTPLYPVRIRHNSYASQFQKANTYLVASTTTNEYYAQITNLTTITFETASTNNAAAYNVGLLSQATDIASGQNPVLPDEAVPAILMFAFARLLNKDQRLEEAVEAFKEFVSLAQGVST